MTFDAAADAVFTANKGNLLTLHSRQVGDKLVHWLEIMMKGAETNRQIYDMIAMGIIRSHMIPDLKNDIYLAKPTDRQEFHTMIEQWDTSQPTKRNMYKS